MLLREWLQELGSRSGDHLSLADIERFTFDMDAYAIVMKDGRTFQDNDLDRMLSVIEGEFANSALHPLIEYPFVKGKSVMHITPGPWTASIPPPPTNLLVEQLRQNITYFNLTGSWTPPFKKDNL